MSKLSFLFIPILMMSVMVHARSRVLTHDQFAYLSPSQQNAMVVKLMELAVELESKYDHEVRTVGFSQERFERYTELMKKLSDFIMNPAYAEDSQEYLSWKRHAENFISLMGKGNRCVYAGWPSIVRTSVVPRPGGGSERRNVCVHPKFIGGNPPSEEGRAYQDANACGTINKITCNPAIFGYKQASSRSVFCVQAGLNDAENSSLLCMRAALSDASDANTDSKDKRLQFLRESLAKNPSIFQGVQQFVYKSCVCDNFSSNIHRDYLTYMRPHRTCYGMMQMIGETALCESSESLGIDTAFFQKLNDYTTTESLKSSNPTSVDTSYNAFLGSIKGSSEYTNLCGGDAIVVRPDDNGTPDSNGGAGGNNNGDDITDLNEIVVTASLYKCTATCNSAAATERPPVAEPPPRSEGDQAQGERRGPPPAPASAGMSCEFKFTKKVNGEDVAVTPTNEITTTPESGATSMTVNAHFPGREEADEVTCQLENPSENDSTTPPDLSLEVSKGTSTDTTQEVKAKVIHPENKGDYKITWYRQGGAEAKPPRREREERPRGLAQDAPEERPEGEQPTEERRPPPRENTDSIISDATDKESIIEERKAEPYKVCAKLTAEGKPDIAGGCVDIAKLENKPAKPALVPGANGQAVQPQIPRGSSSISAGGIR